MEHKRLITAKENANITKYEQKTSDYMQQSVIIKKNLASLNLKLGELMKKQKEFIAVRVKLKNIDEKQKMREDLFLQQEELKRKVGDINLKKIQLNEKLALFKDITEDYERIRKDLDSILEEEKKLEIEKNGLGREKESIRSYLLGIEKDIRAKLEAKKRLI